MSSISLLRRGSQANVHCSHGISKPVVDRDFFYHQTERSLARARKTVFVGLDAKAGHRCLHCTGRLGLRVRIIDDLMKHLRHGCVLCIRIRTRCISR